MAATPRVVLVFEGERYEVAASLINRRGALRVCAREAETQYGLVSQSYSFFNAHGKVDSLGAFERALAEAASGTCEFQIREDPEGRRMRMAMAALENRIMTRVGASLLAMRQDIDETNAKVTANLVELKTTIDELSMEAFESRADLLADVADTHREALESRSDLIAHIDELSREAFEARADTLASMEDLEVKLNGLVQDTSGAIKNMELLEMQFEEDFAAEITRGFDAPDELDQVQAEVCALSQRPTTVSVEAVAPTPRPASSKGASSSVTGRTQSACVLDLEEPLHSVSSSKNKKTDAWLQWSKESLASIPFSSKTANISQPHFAVEKKMPPFASAFSVHRPRSSARMVGCNSMPLLTPLC